MTLQKLQEDDLRTVLEWRNHDSIRMNMRSSHVISYEEHRAWFERIRQDNSALWYIFVDASNNKRGIVYFTDYDANTKKSFFGFYASPGSFPGVGAKIEFEALEHAFNVLYIHSLFCDVFDFNRNALQMHLKFGFEFADTEQGEQFNVIRLRMLADAWNVNRSYILKYIHKMKF